MAEPLVISTMRQFKQQLLLRDADQMRVMARRWLEVEQQLDANISVLSREVGEMHREGKTVSDARLYRLQRFQSLKRQTESEFEKYAAWATTEITEQQRGLSKLGINHAAQAIGNTYSQFGMVGAFDRLPIDAVESMAGIAGNGRPVGELLRNRINPHYSDARAANAWQNLTQTLIKNTALGRNPRETARQMQGDLAGGLQKGLVIARSEQLRVYRQANQQQYEESGVVSGHRRLAAHNLRTCLACLADEGKVYPVTVPISDHPAGRCTSIPVVIGLPELQFQTGSEWLETLSEEEQRGIMGNARYEMWREGTSLQEFIEYTDHPIWGPGLTPKAVSKVTRGQGPAAAIATAVWGNATRTLTSFGTLAADIWAYATRTLTQTGTSVAATVAGDKLSIRTGDTFSASITGLGSLALRSKMWFTVKTYKTTPDSGAVIQFDLATGLLYLNGASGTASNGSIAIDDEDDGDITLTLDEVETLKLAAATGLYYDIKMLDTNGLAVTLREGTCDVVLGVTKTSA